MRYVMFLAMISCSGEKPGADADADDGAADDPADADTDADADADSDADADTDSAAGTGDTSSGDVFFDPVAVGFEYVGGVLSDGSLSSYRAQGDPAGEEYVPYIFVTFASVAYFSAGPDAAGDAIRLAESCTVPAYLVNPPYLVTLPPIPVAQYSGGPNPIYSYDLSLPIDATRSTCFDAAADGGKLDPAIWGPGGSTIDLLDAFTGAHFGLAFGQITPYITDAFTPPTTPEEIEFMTGVFSEYIAINDSAGAWVAVDWSYGVLFQWDEPTREAIIDTSTNPPQYVIEPLNGGFPSGFVISGAYWYQDFPLLDLSNLKDGAPL